MTNETFDLLQKLYQRGKAMREVQRLRRPGTPIQVRREIEASEHEFDTMLTDLASMLDEVPPLPISEEQP